MASKRQRIDQARETRLWIGQIVVPTVSMIATAIVAIPELRQGVMNKYYDVKNTLKEKIDDRKKGKADSDGVCCMICGKPAMTKEQWINAGKPSVMHAHCAKRA